MVTVVLRALFTASNYKGNTPETVQNTAFLYSLNGVDRGGEGGGGGETADQPKGTGTVDNPFNVAAAVAKCKEAGETATTEEYYIKGKVKTVTEEFTTNYGNGTFTIVDNGFTQIFTAYRVLYLGNKKFATGDTQIKEGDEVIIKAKIMNFKGNTPETSGGFLYSLNGNTGGGGGEETADQPKGTGTVDNPFNVAGAVVKCKEAGSTATTDVFYVKGIVDAEYTVDSYKNATFDMVDNGFTQKFKAYRVVGPNGESLKQGYKIPKGATVVVCGKLVNYGSSNPTPETAQGSGKLISVNGQAPELDDGQGGGGSGGGEVSGNTITVAASSFGLENASELSTLNLTDGTKLTFDAGGNKTTPKYYAAGSGSIRMYPNNQFTINAGSKKITAIELICDEYQGTLYNASGNITVDGATKSVEGASLKYTGLNASTAVVKNTAEGSGAATQLRLVTLKITYAE